MKHFCSKVEIVENGPKILITPFDYHDWAKTKEKQKLGKTSETWPIAGNPAPYASHLLTACSLLGLVCDPVTQLALADISCLASLQLGQRSTRGAAHGP